MFEAKFLKPDYSSFISTLFLTMVLSTTVVLANFLSLSLAAEIVFSITFFYVAKIFTNKFGINI